MAQLALGIVGGVVGAFFGMPALGFMIGSTLGGLLFPEKVDLPPLEDLKLQDSTFGKPIPKVFGRMRLAGNVIWQIPELIQHQQTSGGKGGPEVTSHTYSASWAVGWVGNPILGYLRFWAAGRLVYDSTSGSTVANFPFTPYLGTETQLPDPTMESFLGAGQVTAHRGMAYTAHDDAYLTDYGNTIPLLEAEVFTAAGVYPWRVSSFSPWDIATEPNFGVWNATYLDGVITVTSLSLGGFRTKKFAIDGTQIGVTTDQLPPGGLLGWGSGVRNTNSFPMFYNAGDGTHINWYSPNQTGVFLQGFEITPGALFVPAQTTGNANIETGGFWYTVSGNVGTTHIARYQIGGAFIDYVFLDTHYSPDTVALGSSDTGHLYVIAEDPGPLVRMWRFNPDLTLDKFWTPAETAGTFLRANGNFHVYKNQICIEWKQNVVGIPSLIRLVKIGAGNILSDHTTTLARSTAYGFVINLSGGLMLDANGVFSLDPPPAAVTLGSIVAAIAAEVGDTPDVSALTDLVDGYILNAQMSAKAAVDGLRPAYSFDGAEIDDVVVFVKRGGPSVATITLDELAAREFGAEAPPKLQLVRTLEAELPRTVTVKFIDGTRDYQINTAYDRREVTSSTLDTTYELPINMTPGKARSIAKKLLYEAWVERDHYTFSPHRKYARLVPTDVVTVDGIMMRVEKKTEAPNGIFTFDAVATLAEIYAQSETDGVTGSFAPQILLPPGAAQGAATALMLLDIPMVDDLDFDHGFYVAMGPAASTGSWPGAALYRSVDGGTTYQSVASVTTADTIGTATTQLPAHAGGYVFDEASQVTVLLTSGSLSSATELAVLNGSNMAVLGLEIIQFKTAALIAANTYTLSGLLRGRRGTEDAIPGHAIGERFALLPLTNVDTPIGNLFQTALYKAVTFGGTIAGATAVPFANMGAAARPYSPVEVGGGPNGAGDLIIEWTRRTRIGGAWNDFSDVSIGETTTQYVAQIWNATYSLCARIISGLTSETTTYTAAQQVTDFGATQSIIYVTVAQLGAYELGNQTRAVLPGAGASVSAILAPIPPYNASPTPPPGGTGGVVNQTIASYPTGSVTTAGVVVGDTYVVQFNSSASPVLTSVSVAEYTDPPTYRTVVLSTDVNGNNVIATFYGNTASYTFTPAASTAYYVIIRVLLPDGTTGRPLGEGADLICSIGAA